MTTFVQELEEHGSVIYTNKGISMMPLLRQDRDIMVIEKRTPARCKKYDAVLFLRDNGQYILHRILKLKPGGYYIVGDNCIHGEYVREEQVLGVLTSIRRGQRTIKVTDPGYLCYVYVLRPVRRLLLRPIRFIRRGIRFVARRVLKRKRNAK